MINRHTPPRFKRLAARLVLALAIASLLLPGTSAARDAVQELGSGDQSKRFQAALSLLSGGGADRDARLRQALEQEPFRSNKEAKAALDFVIWKRAGRPPVAPRPAEARGPNVLLISIDSLRADHLGCYGYPRGTSPNIDSVARRGVLFRQAISPAPWTLPAHMSIFTSLYPSFHKLEKGGRVGSLKLDVSEVTLAQILGPAGYVTAGLAANPFLDGKWGFDRGFDLYLQSTSTAETQSRRAAVWVEWHSFHVARGLSPDRFFLFVHYIDPHEPYSPPRRYKERFTGGYDGALGPADNLVTKFSDREFENSADFQYVLGLYDAEVSYVDASLKLILDALDEAGWRDSTLVVITSDHGEEFKDHGAMGHKGSLYDEQLLVPLILSWPALIAPGQVIQSQASLLDLAPTILDLAERRAEWKPQGISLVPYMKTNETRDSPPSIPPRTLFAELGPLGIKWERPFHIRAARTNDLKLIYGYSQKDSVTKELYDLKSDPDETLNVYHVLEHHAGARDLEKKLVEFIRNGAAYNPGFREKNKIVVDEELMEKLRSLGYIDN